MQGVNLPGSNVNIIIFRVYQFADLVRFREHFRIFPTGKFLLNFSPEEKVIKLFRIKSDVREIK